MLALVALTIIEGPAYARETEPRVVVRFAARLPRNETARLLSALRAQLREIATVDVERIAPSTIVVDIDRIETGLSLRFEDGAGRVVGAPRVVTDSGESGASEAATIVRAFVVAKTDLGQTEDDRSETKRAPDVSSELSASIAPPPLQNGREPSGSGDTSNAGRKNLDPDGIVGASRAPSRTRIAAFYTGATYASELTWQSGARLEGHYAFFPAV
jgi:hypothetical protein